MSEAHSLEHEASESIHVTKAFLPPLAEYQTYLQEIWASGQLTNQGPLLKEFEKQVIEYLGVDNFQLVGNGTMALQVALRALDITEGEIITTPFSYVATTSAIMWERCTPVYVDIRPDDFCIDPNKIEAAITPRTKAVMAVHVFGMPCDVEAIERIAEQYGLKVIYDAAHAFGVRYKGRSLLSYGDASTASFHATKLMHTIEGGGMFFRDKAVAERADLVKRFGHHGDEHFTIGINGKASEFQAAMGLCNLKYIDSNIARRKQLTELYDSLLGPEFERLKRHSEVDHNYAYYPVVAKNEGHLLRYIEMLKERNIFPRRYFYPSLNRLPYLKDTQQCPASEDIAAKIMCLPLYADLPEDKVRLICGVINS